MTKILDLPDWVFGLVLASERYEEFHSKSSQPGNWDCLAQALDAVPSEVRSAAQLADRWAKSARAASA